MNNLQTIARALQSPHTAIAGPPADALDLAFDRIGSRAAFDRDQTVFCEGEPAERVLRVTHGAFRLTKMLPDGRRQVAAFVLPGEYLGLAASELYPFTAEAVTAAGAVAFPRRAIEAMTDRDPRFGRRLVALVCQELALARDQMLLLARMTAAERIARFLVQLAERQAAKNGVLLPMGRADIADHLGLTVETVSRTMTELKRRRLIALPTPCEVVFLKRVALSELADGDSDSALSSAA